MNKERSHSVSVRAASSAFIIGAMLLILAFPAGCVVFVQALRSQTFDLIPAVIDALVMAATMASFGMLLVLLSKWYFRRNSADTQGTPTAGEASPCIRNTSGVLTDVDPELRKDNTMRSRTKISFLICGIIGITVFVLWQPVQALVMRRVCQMNYLRNGAFFMHQYSADHNGMFPTNVAEVRVYASTAMHFHCPGRPLQSPVRWANINEWMDYIYVYWPEGEKTPHDYPQMYDRRLANHGGAGINIALVDGSSFWDGQGQWLRKFAETHPQYRIQLPEDMLKEPR